MNEHKILNDYLRTYSYHDRDNNRTWSLKFFSINNYLNVLENCPRLSLFYTEMEILKTLWENDRNLFPEFRGGFIQRGPDLKMNLILIMEIGGITLRELENQKRFSEEEALYILKDLVEILVKLQDLKIFHGAINLENISLDRGRNKPYIVNFQQGSPVNDDSHDPLIEDYFDSVDNESNIYAPEIRNTRINNENKFNPYKYDSWVLGECILKILGKRKDEVSNENLKKALGYIREDNWEIRWDARRLWEHWGDSGILRELSKNPYIYDAVERDGRRVLEVNIQNEIDLTRDTSLTILNNDRENLDIIKNNLKKIKEPADRGKVIEELCNPESEINKNLTQLIKPVQINPPSEIIINKLKPNCPVEFLSVISNEFLLEKIEHIENITGFDILSEISHDMIKINITSDEFDKVNFLSKHKENVREAFIQDLTQVYNIERKDLKIRTLTPEGIGIELLFSIPKLKKNELSETVVPLPTTAQLTHIKELLKNNGIKNPNFEFKQTSPNKQKALELLNIQSSPIVLNAEINSKIGEKIRPYVPALADLSNDLNSKQNQNNNELELFGTQAAKASFANFLVKLDDLMNDYPKIDKIINFNEQNKVSLTKYPLWLDLYKGGKEFALQYSDTRNPMQTESLIFNRNLEYSCPAGINFISGLKKLGFEPEDKDINEAGCFAWYAPDSEIQTKNIAINGLNITQRKAQVFGQGEYFGKTAQVSQHFWKKTNTLFVFFILTKNKDKTPNKAFYDSGFDTIVLNNPDPNTLFCVPILTATFNNMPPYEIFTMKETPNIVWQWEDNMNTWRDYGVKEANQKAFQINIEAAYSDFLKNNMNKILKLNLIRFDNGKIDAYELDFEMKIQTNLTSSYYTKRKMQRLESKN